MMMSDKEFDVLDELYFLQSFASLEKLLPYGGRELAEILENLIVKEWVRCYKAPDDEIKFDKSGYWEEYHKYYYLASKEGLLAHNSSF
jgi:hypothetical protein